MSTPTAPTLPAINAHKEIPGNPSTAKSSQLRLNDRNNGEPLRLLTEKDWDFWITNGYVIIKTRYQKNRLKNWRTTSGNMKAKTPTT
jgi:hypothetical protein